MKNNNAPFPHLFIASLCLVCVSLTSAAELEPWQQAQKTEVWEPIPSIVSTAKNSPPSDAIVLFSRDSLDAWVSEKDPNQAAPWKVEGDIMTVAAGAGGIQSKQGFCDLQLHIEWRTPTGTEDQEGQARSNSGVFFQQRYEVQVLDSFNNQTYPNGQAASVYKQHIPLVNATRPPGEWNVYDIIFSAPKFNKKGELEKPAYLTVIHNGVLVQNHVEVQGPTAWIGHPPYEAHDCAPLSLQDHGNPVSFRNIWVREL